MRHRVEGFPGVKFNFSQVIETRNDELISGINAQIAVKVFGEDQDTLRNVADQIRDAMSHVRGVEDLAVEQSAGEEHLEIDVERDKIARYGLNIADVLEVAKIAIGGDEATDVLEGQRRFAIFVRLKEDYRNQVEKLGDILVAAPIGGKIPLGQIATFKLSSGDSLVTRENSLRREVVMCNVKGRDIGSFVHDAQQPSRCKSKCLQVISSPGAASSRTRSRQRAGCSSPFLSLFCWCLCSSIPALIPCATRSRSSSTIPLRWSAARLRF
jgi:cobalt-zinc-cadmium resistance protein CzcA